MKNKLFFDRLNGGKPSASVPADAKAWYYNLVAADDFVVSTPVEEARRIK